MKTRGRHREEAVKHEGRCRKNRVKCHTKARHCEGAKEGKGTGGEINMSEGKA